MTVCVSKDVWLVCWVTFICIGGDFPPLLQVGNQLKKLRYKMGKEKVCKGLGEEVRVR